MNAAAANGHLDVVKWLHANRPVGCTTLAMDVAAADRDTEMVKWLISNRSDRSTPRGKFPRRILYYKPDGTDYEAQLLKMRACRTCNPFYASSNKKQLKFLKWLRQSEPRRTKGIDVDAVAADGNLEILQQMHKCSNAACTTDATDAAAGLGGLDIVEWLHENRLEGCSSKAIDKAAANGHLDIVKWLYAKRMAKCTTLTMQQAAAHGQTHVIKCLLSNCPRVGIMQALGYAAYHEHFGLAIYCTLSVPMTATFGWCGPLTIMIWSIGPCRRETVPWRSTPG